jgi:phosphoglycerol transferase MdoB-like AlkP superfamily enzyme
MKKRLLYLIVTYLVLLVVFALEKPLFMLFQNSAVLTTVSAGDWFWVVWHGLRLDVSVAGYVVLVPWIVVFTSIWVKGARWPGVTIRLYFIVVALLLVAVFVGNTLLYPFWGFPLDATPLFYLRSPSEVVASVPVWFVAVGLVSVFVLWILLNRGLGKITKLLNGARPVINKVWWSALMLIIGGVLFLGIRGGAGQSTANVGRVYFSDNMFLNHAAVNPVFSLLESAAREHNLAKGYTFMDESERAAVFDSLKAPEGDSIRRVLKTERPDILIVLLESFTTNILATKVDDKEVTPRFNALMAEGVWFPEFYAASFRTDRGLVATLNGYPAQPTTSIMKYPAKSQTLPSIAGILRNAGYTTEMLYGGDIDFTNMRSYFYASGYQTVTGSDRLHLSAKKGEWGYDDRVMFAELLSRMQAKTPDTPSFTTFLTLSSHEPFRVPDERFADPVLNAMAFTDDCLGEFIDGLKQSAMWDNLLVILVADHALTYPPTLKNYDTARHHIPMLWLGGAVAEPFVVAEPWSQVDIAATLLGQLELKGSDFRFSHNIFDHAQRPMAFYTFNNGFGFIDPSGETVWDCDGSKALVLQGDSGAKERELQGKAILQTLMEDLDRR